MQFVNTWVNIVSIIVVVVLLYFSAKWDARREYEKKMNELYELFLDEDFL